MIADSLGRPERSRWLWMSRTWSLVIIPPMIVGQPVIIRGNQSSRAVVQFQCRISQCIGNAILSKLRANGAHNHPLWFSPLNNETANHHVVTRLHKAASTNVA